jgi:pimeloyl-ACP methyl ester carboxylesterase
MSKVLSNDGTAIAFDKLGKGEPIILVDGALCSRSFGPLPKLAQLLAPHFTVFNYDRRGRNKSGDHAPYAVQREVEDIEALIKEAGGSASVFGTSSGAALALAAAANKLNVKKLALYEPPFVAGRRSGRGAPPDSEAQLKRLVAENRRGDAVKFFMVDMVGLPPIFTYIMRVLPIWPKLKAVAHTLPYDAAVLGDFSLPRERAASVAIPTLVIGGEKSPVELRGAVDAVAQTIPGAKLQMLKGQTHNVSVKVLAPVLVDFFRA